MILLLSSSAPEANRPTRTDSRRTKRDQPSETSFLNELRNNSSFFINTFGGIRGWAAADINSNDEMGNKSWIIKVFEGLPKFLRGSREGLLLF